MARKPLITLLFALLPMLLAACSPLHALNGFLPEGDYAVRKDLAYGPLSNQHLDVYLPGERRRREALPMLIFLHGGAWHTGGKNEYVFVGDQFAHRGIVTIIPDFRLYPEVRFPVFLQDAALVVRWAVDHAEELGGDPARIYLAGHSSGAHMAAMLAFDPQWLAAQKLDNKQLAGVIGLAGAYDFLPISEPLVKKIFATASPPQSSQPVNFVVAGLPPALLAVGLDDHRVNPRNTFSLAEKLQSAGDRVLVASYPDVGHAGLLLSLSRPLQYLTDVADRMARFINSDSEAISQ